MLLPVLENLSLNKRHYFADIANLLCLPSQHATQPVSLRQYETLLLAPRNSKIPTINCTWTSAGSARRNLVRNLVTGRVISRSSSSRSPPMICCTAAVTLHGPYNHCTQYPDSSVARHPRKHCLSLDNRLRMLHTALLQSSPSSAAGGAPTELGAWHRRCRRAARPRGVFACAPHAWRRAPVFEMNVVSTQFD